VTLQLELSSETEARVRAEAAASGRAITALVAEAIEEKFGAAAATHPSRMPPEEWAARLDAWAESHRRLGYEADASRESIYAGRGE